jgi:tetratricopeptide (TPR) repeat protein
MYRHSGKAASTLLLIVSLCSGPAILAQQGKASSELSPEKAIKLAEQGRCQESISALKRAMAAQVPAETRKQAGVDGVRCSLDLDDRNAALDFIRFLNRQFGRDPDVLFVIVHAYSDLSTRTAQDLGRKAPQSLAAHKLNAEAFEVQGKWQQAQLEYEYMIQKEPNARGIHFLLGRLLLSRPDAPADAAERAKQEFQKELQIDPSNGDAEFILGELARQNQQWDDAIAHFGRAIKLNPGFGDAYLGLGQSLVSTTKFSEAIQPLETAVKLEPRNPATHYSLAMAYSRTGHKEEAEKEFAIHRTLTSAARTPDTDKPE